MDIRKYFQHYLLVIFLISIHRGFCSLEDDYEDSYASGRCPRIRSILKNGRVRLRSKGRVAKFLCDAGYELAGKRSSTCLRGQWSNPTPVCVARGCNRVPSIANGRVTEMYRGALLVYDCNPGYTLSGEFSIHCDGRQWNASAPTCTVYPDVRPETKCDFESPTLCGWTHDPTHDFDWFRNQFATPSGHVGTGPEYDHTFGENKAGYYMYIEASSPRKTNDTARLFSPVYPSQESGGCFTFWYHMYGATTGGLRVYFKPESHVFGELSPKWEKFGDQGNQWLQGNISVPAVNENFQIIIEGIRGESYVGDSAIDDVNLSTLDCQAMENENSTTSEVTATNSCRGRCRTTSLPEDSCECMESCIAASTCCNDYTILCSNVTATNSCRGRCRTTSLPEDSCECKESCIAASTCCNDYTILCSNGNETIEQNSNEPETGDYYGSPLTVTVYLPTETTTEVKYSNATSNVLSQLTSQRSVSSITYPSSTITVPFADVSTSPSMSSTSSTYLTTDATKSSTAATVKTEPQTVADRSTSSRTSSVIPVVETSYPKPIGKAATISRLSTTPESVTSTSSNSVKPTPSTKTTPMISSRSTPKTPSISQTNSLTKISITVPLTTSTTTTQRSTTTTTTTQRSTTTTTTQRSTTTTPVSTTHSSTTTTPMSTTQSSTTTTPMSTTQSSTTTTPMSTTQSSTTSTPSSTTTTSTSTSTSTSTMPTTTSSTTLKLVPLTLIQSMSLSTLISTPSLTSSVSQSSTVSTTTTPRYNLRPRKTTSISTSAGTTQSSSTRTSPISSSTTASTFKTVSSTVSSAMTPSRSGWRFDFKFSSTSMVSSTITSPSYRLPIYIQKTSNYPNNEPKSTTPLQPLSTPDSYEMVASKTESSKSSGSSSVITGVVIFSIICMVGIAIFYFRRRRSKRLSNLEDDSELRFLPDSDYMEYSDASTLDRILAD